MTSPHRWWGRGHVRYEFEHVGELVERMTHVAARHAVAQRPVGVTEVLQQRSRTPARDEQLPASRPWWVSSVCAVLAVLVDRCS